MNSTNDTHGPLFTFLSKMNHDLRTPLTAMLNMIGLMKENPQLHCTADNLKLIQEAGEELKSLLQNITDLAKLEAGRLKLKSETVALRDLLKNATSQFAAEAQRKNLDFQIDVDGDVPDQIVTDKQRLSQILSHLLSNAVAYTEQGGVIVRTSRGAPAEDAPGSLGLVFSVEDSGPGIPEDLQKNLFDRFLAAGGDGLVKTGSGSGLGLAVSKRLVQLMGGRLQVHSTVGKGSTFSFDLPVRQAAQVSGGQAPVPPEGASLADLGPLRVLVVEDNFINLLSFSQMLERHGLKIQSASNGRQALDYLHQETFDIVLMDVKMPVMDGLEATRRIRGSPDRRVSQTRVVALTAYGMPEDRQRILAAGVDDIVSKPIEAEELANVLRRVLGR